MNKEREPNMIFLHNISGGKSYVLVDETSDYFFRFESALHDIEQGKGDECDYLYFAFIALSSATLEYSLNQMLAVYCFMKYHDPIYKTHLEAYSRIQFGNKIVIIPSLVSDGEFILDKESSIINNLFELVKTRNSLLHNSKSVCAQDYEAPDVHACIKGDYLYIPASELNDELSIEFPIHIERNLIQTLSKEQCIKIGEAMLKYREYVIEPYLSCLKFEENDILKRNGNVLKIANACVSVKHPDDR